MITRALPTVRSLTRRPVATAAALIVIGLCFYAAFAKLPGYATSHDVLRAPGPRHWLGTNDIGQDVLVGILTATPNTVIVPILVALISLLISGAFVALAATQGGFVQTAVLRGVEILQVLPSMFLLLLLATWVRPGFAGVILLLAVTSWHDDARILRAIVLREMTRESLHFARVNDAGWIYCLRRHLLPSVWPAVMALYIQNVRGGVMQIAGLSFLGLTDPRLVTWGSMLQDALAHLFSPAWSWLLLPPALALFLALLILAGQRLEERALAGSAVRR